MGGGKSRYSVEIFLSHSAGKVSQGDPLLVQYFRVPEKFGYERGGVSRYSVEKFLPHNAKNIRR